MGEDVDQLEPPLYWRFLFTILHIFNLFLVFMVVTITDLYLIQSILAFLLFKDNFPPHQPSTLGCCWGPSSHSQLIGNHFPSPCLFSTEKTAEIKVTYLEDIVSNCFVFVLNPTKILQVSRGARVDVGDKEGSTALALAKRSSTFHFHNILLQGEESQVC